MAILITLCKLEKFLKVHTVLIKKMVEVSYVGLTVPHFPFFQYLKK